MNLYRIFPDCKSVNCTTQQNITEIQKLKQIEWSVEKTLEKLEWSVEKNSGKKKQVPYKIRTAGISKNLYNGEKN